MLLLLTGCQALDQTHAFFFGYEYNFAYCNASSQNLHDVGCINEPGPTPCGELVRGGVATSECRFPLPDQLIVQWKDDTQTIHTASLQIKSLIDRPDVFSGNVVIAFGNDNAVKVLIKQHFSDVLKIADGTEQ